MKRTKFFALCMLAANLAFAQTASKAVPAASKPASSAKAGLKRPVKITQGEYHGWKDAIFLSNGKAEVVIVPAIGRIMQFRLLGGQADNGVFWENPAMAGKLPDPKSSDWGNFGGDKSWPSPQADWPKVTPRKWPPPVAFDSMPVEVSYEFEGCRGFERPAPGKECTAGKNAPDTIYLTSAVDPDYGIREIRRIVLHPSRAELIVDTYYQKLAGDPVKVGVWVITQMKEPERNYITSPVKTVFPERYAVIEGNPPYEYQALKGLISNRRDPKNPTKIGNDGDALVWVGLEYTLKIVSPRVKDAKAEYPDQGSSTEIYTSPDPNQYVELETLGPLSTMKKGDTISRKNVYTLSRRVSKDPEAEARRVLGAK